MCQIAENFLFHEAYRGFKVRQKYGPLLNSKTGKIDLETSKFIRPFAKRWKVKSIFQILLLYRSARYQDLVNLTQQVCMMAFKDKKK